MCKIGEVGDYEIRAVYQKLCDEGILKDEFKIIKRKGLTDALDFPRNFKEILRRINDMELWLENGLIKNLKKMIHDVAGYPTIDKKKMMHCQSREEIESNTKSEWNG